MSIAKKIQKNIKTKQQQDDIDTEKWVDEHPTRGEVSNYINALWERHYLPTITNYIQMSSMVLQAILIEKGICTGDEIKDITEKFVSEQQRRLAMETAENGLIGRLSKAIAYLNEGKWEVNEKTALSSALNVAKQHLVDINFNNDTSSITDEDMETCAENLESIKSSIDDGSIQIKDDAGKQRLLLLVMESIQRFKKGIHPGDSNEKS